jgi:hypothetical protein
MPAHIGVDQVIGQRAEKNEEGKDGGQQRGSEKNAGVDEVQGAESPQEDLSAGAVEAATGSARKGPGPDTKRDHPSPATMFLRPARS